MLQQAGDNSWWGLGRAATRQPWLPLWRSVHFRHRNSKGSCHRKNPTPASDLHSMLRQAGDGTWGGLWRACNAAALAADAARLYSEPRLWTACQQAGFKDLPRLYDAQV